MTMLMGRASKTEGRRGSQRRLDEGGRYLGIPPNGGLAAPRTGSDDADAHNSGCPQYARRSLTATSGCEGPRLTEHA